MHSLVPIVPFNVFVEQYTEEDYNSLVRKIDFVLLPLMWVLYGLQQADKTEISTQATFNMRADLGVEGQDYALLTTIFYLLYLVFEAPVNYVMQRINMGDVIVLCTGFVTTWTKMMVLRALQGALENVISPAFLLQIGARVVSYQQTHPAKYIGVGAT
ncbi:hypothetical protein F5146DRAFT_1132597 [Armillaria mellea]|nr:hypothetical protein F5146DRAFT_1132597 [Armillaria mellea]